MGVVYVFAFCELLTADCMVLYVLFALSKNWLMKLQGVCVHMYTHVMLVAKHPEMRPGQD